MNKIRPRRFVVLDFLKTAEILTRISTSHPTNGMIKRMILTILSCFSNHLSNVIMIFSFFDTKIIKLFLIKVKYFFIGYLFVEINRLFYIIKNYIASTLVNKEIDGH